MSYASKIHILETYEETERLAKKFNDIEINWDNDGGITIDKLASQFKIE